MAGLWRHMGGKRTAYHRYDDRDILADVSVFFAALYICSDSTQNGSLCHLQQYPM